MYCLLLFFFRSRKPSAFVEDANDRIKEGRGQATFVPRTKKPYYSRRVQLHTARRISDRWSERDGRKNTKDPYDHLLEFLVTSRACDRRLSFKKSTRLSLSDPYDVCPSLFPHSISLTLIYFFF